MGRPKQDGKYNKNNIISMRVSDDELEAVQKVVALTNSSASAVMREAVQYFLSHWIEEHSQAA